MATMKAVFDAYEARVAQLKTSSNPYAEGVAWIEGVLVPLHEARIPLLDEGFMHGDLTYDVPAVWDGRFFRLDDHMDRFERSLDKMRLHWPLPRKEVRATLVDMVRKSGIRDVYVEIIVTRGLRGVRGTPAAEIPHMANRLYLFIKPYVWVMSPEMQLAASGSAVITRSVHRTSPDSFDPTIKNLQWGDLTRAIFEAQDRGAVYPFLSDGAGNLTEGAGFNIVIVKDGILRSPARGVLEGVTRTSVVDSAALIGREMRIEAVPLEDVYNCDEIFMCTTAGGIMPITSLDDKPIGDGKVGPITAQIWDTYWKLHQDVKLSFEVAYD